MPARQPKRKPTPSNTGADPRHLFVPRDFVSDESWKTTFPMIDPLVPVTLDRGTFEWLWDFVARKGRQADANNFNMSDIHKDVYQRAADQFANAAKEAFGDAYQAEVPTKGTKKAAEEPSEAPVEPSKPRRRRKRVSATVEKFEAAESLLKTSKAKRRRKPRSGTPS